MGVEEEGGAEGEDAGQGGAPEIEGADAPARPKYDLNDDALGEQRFMVSDEEIGELFGPGTLEGLEQKRSRWVARFSGDGLDGPSADPIRTASLIRRMALTARWISNGLYPGRGAVPGFVLGEATHSIVLEFAIAADEKPLTVAVEAAEPGEQDEGEEDARERRTVYPSVEGGRYFGTLLASSENPEQLIERFGVVGRQAVRLYQGALQEFVKFDAELDLLIPTSVAAGETELRKVTLPTASAEAELDVLRRKPEEVTDTIEVEGLLYTQNSLKTEFGIRRDNEQNVTGEYDIRVADKLGPAWDKRVWARIQNEGPKQDWMPRAGRTRRVLLDVEVLAEGETRLG